MKSFKFTIGHAGRKPVRMDAITLADSRLLACTNSGGGKSYLLRGLVEQVGAKIPTIILDPEGEFSTLREKLDMVLVGNEGDIDPDPRSAALLCRKLIELRLSAVIDLYELKIHERRGFVRTFLEALIDLPRKLWGPTFIVIDEAHKFCPERGSGQAESTDAVISLMSQGRKRGFGGCLVTQRLSKLHKDAVGECNNVMIGRCVQDVDLKRSGDILGLSSVKERNHLRSLKPGEFHAFGPAFDHDGILLFRSREVETTHPDARTRHKLRSPAPSKAIKKVLPDLADLPARAADEKATLEASQAEVKRLGREVVRLKKAQPEPEIDQDAVNTAVNTAVEKAVNDRDGQWNAWYENKILRGINDISKVVGRTVEAFSKIGDGIGHLADRKPDFLDDVPRARVVKAHRRKVTPAATSNGKSRLETSRRTVDRSSADGNLSPSGHKILSALVQYPDGLDTKRLGIISGLATRGGSYNKTMATLRQEQYIEGGGGSMLKITPLGIEAVGEPEPLPTGQDLLEHWKGKLRNKSAETILVAFVEHETLTTEELGDVTGLATRGGSFNKAMARLRAMDLIRGGGRQGKMNINPDLAEAIRE